MEHFYELIDRPLHSKDGQPNKALITLKILIANVGTKHFKYPIRIWAQILFIESLSPEFNVFAWPYLIQDCPLRILDYDLVLLGYLYLQ